MTRLAILLRTSFLILTLICASQTMARSQKYKVTIKVKEQKLMDVFKSIQQQTNLIVFYSNTILNDQEKVSIQVKDEPLEKVLDKIIAGKALKYEVQEKYIVIAPKEEKKGGKEIKEGMSAEDIAPLPPPTIDVSGRVTDEDGNPLMGASVMIKGTKIGTQTNAEGYFTLKGIDNDAILEISFIGFEKQQISVKGVNSVRVVVLKRADDLLSEVIVRPYHKELARFSLSPVSRVTSKEIMQTPVGNPLLVLQGRVTGVNVVQQTGVNGAAATIRVQGDNSIGNSNNPLVVVDGVPYPLELPLDRTAVSSLIGGGFGSPLSFLNMNDIESIDVLKDADATSIYGSRAANGAILITTKKAKSGKMRADINLQQGWSQVPRRLEMMTTEQYLEMRLEAIKNTNLIPTDQTGLFAPYSFAPDLTIWDQSRYTDWQRVLIGGTAQLSNFNASLSGGTSLSSYRIGLTYSRNTDVFPGEHSLKQGGLSFNINTSSQNQRFKLQLNGSYSNQDNSLPGVDLTAQALQLVPLAPALYSGDTLNWAPNSQGMETWVNPLANTFYSSARSNGKALMSNASISYKIIEGLQLSASLGYNQNISESSSKIPLLAIRPSSRPNSSRSARFSFSQNHNLMVEPQLSYNRKIGQLIINTTLGTTFQQNTTQAQGFLGSDYSSDLYLNGISAAGRLTSYYSKSIFRYSAAYGLIRMNWDGKYIVNINARRDGSSRFGDKNKFHNFGSIGVGWIFSEEKWVRTAIPWFSFGKLRGSYGTTGNDGVADYSYLSQNLPFSSSSLLLYGGSPSAYRNNLDNPILQWEETRKLSIGADLGFWNERILVGITFSRNRSTNQLLPMPLPSITGFASLDINFPAIVENRSWEMILSTKNLAKENFMWTSFINLTIPRNELVAFPDIENTTFSNPRLGVIVGHPLFVKQFNQYTGVNPQTGLYSSNTSVQEYISIAPIYYGGMQHRFTYKSVSLDFLFEFRRHWGKREFEYYSGELSPGGFLFGKGNQPVSVLNRWQKPGDQAFAAIYSATGTASIVSGILANTSAYYTLDASYVRLKNASLSWQMPKSLLKKLGLQSGRIYALGQNLITFTKFAGLDPENQSSTSLPPLRTWTIGLQLGL